MIAERTFPGAGDRTMFFRHSPAGEPTGVVVIVHGFGEHGGRYLETMRRFAEYGLSGYTMDLRGFGHNSRVVADMEGLTLVAEDLRLLTELARGENPGAPVVLLGHSMGGLLALNQLIVRPDDYDLAITIAPSILPPENASKLAIFMARILARVAPRLPISPLEENAGTRDPEMLERDHGDELLYTGGFRARTGYELLRLQLTIRDRLHEITVPILGMHGGGDLIMNPRATEIMIESIGSADKTMHIFPDLYHEVMNEPERDVVFGVMFEWLDKRLPG